MFCLPAYPCFGQWKGLAEDQNAGRKEILLSRSPSLQCPNCERHPFCSPKLLSNGPASRVSPHQGYGNIVSSLPVQSWGFLCCLSMDISVPFTSSCYTAHSSLTGTFIKSHLDHLVRILFLSRTMNNSSIMTVFLKLPKCSLRLLLNIVPQATPTLVSDLALKMNLLQNPHPGMWDDGSQPHHEV